VTAMFLWESDNYYISECVFVALVIRHEMRRIVSPLVACLVHHIFPHYLANGKIFGKRLLNIK